MHNDLPRLLALFYTTPWAVRPDFLMVMQSIVERWAGGVKLSAPEIQAAVGTGPADAEQRRQRTGPGAVGIVPIYGLLSPRAHMVRNISGPGGTSTEDVAHTVRRMMSDDSIGAIVLDIDSPGGNAYGVQELGDEIFSFRGQKKIVASVSPSAGSGAYWIATAADEVIVTPSGDVGSVGVFMAHENKSELMKREGREVTFVQAGKYKTEGHPYGALDDESKAYLQTRVDEIYGVFTKSLAKFRGVSVDAVRSEFGEGRMIPAAEAVKRGMADRVEPFDETVARLARSTQAQKPKARGVSSERLRMAELG